MASVDHDAIRATVSRFVEPYLARNPTARAGVDALASAAPNGAADVHWDHLAFRSFDRDAVEGVVRGVRCVLARDPATRALSLAPAPPASQPAPLALRKWVRDAFPAWASLLEELRDDGRYGRGDATDFATRVHPNPTGDDAMPCAVTAVEWVTSYDALKAEVLRDPSFWRDGTPPNAPPATPREQATLNAGEARPIRHTGPHTTAFAL